MLKPSILFLALILLLLAAFLGGARAFSPSFQSCIGEHTDPNSQAVSKENPAGDGVIGRYVLCSGEFIESHAGAISALATLAIAAFTGTLWWANSEQAFLTRRAFVADRRPFIFAVSFSQFWEVDQDTGQYYWRFRPILRNSGKTPPKNMTMFVECEVRNAQLPPGYTFAHGQQRVASGVIPPGTELHGGLAPQFPDAAITPQDIVDAIQGRKFIYLWGWIKYQDVFPGTPEHITKYCWLILPNGDPYAFDPNAIGKPPAAGTLSFDNIHHVEGNCIDEGCE